MLETLLRYLVTINGYSALIKWYACPLSEMVHSCIQGSY